MSELLQKSQEQYWATEGGDIWLKYLQNFESMIAPIGKHLIETKLADNYRNIIDIGCGGGATTFAIANSIGMNGSVIGVDISQSLIRDCRLRAESQGIKNIEFICGDAASIEMPEEWADLVISRFGVMFFKEPVIAFSHIAQSLKPSGTLAFSCWAPVTDNPWMNKLLTILSKYTSIPKPEPGAPGPFAFSNPYHIRTILIDAGYKDIEVNDWSGDLLIGKPGTSPQDVGRFLMNTSLLVRNVQNSISDMETAILDELTHQLDKYYKNGSVYMPAKSWIITANK